MPRSFHPYYDRLPYENIVELVNVLRRRTPINWTEHPADAHTTLSWAMGQVFKSPPNVVFGDAPPEDLSALSDEALADRIESHLNTHNQPGVVGLPPFVWMLIFEAVKRLIERWLAQRS